MDIRTVLLVGWQAGTGAAGRGISIAELLGPLLGLLAVLIIAIVVARRWSRNNKESSISASEMLTDFRDLKEQGKLSADEYKRIKDVLGGRFRHETQTVGTTGPDVEKSEVPPDGGTQEITKLTTPEMPAVPRANQAEDSK